MENYRLDAHIPGMVWGIVQDGRLVHVKGAGVQDIDTKRPVDADTLFRIASMTKAFTALSILKLRDDGKLRSMRRPRPTCRSCAAGSIPTDDSPKIRVRELLTHTAGFVTDDPWGDRQTPLPEDEFTRLLRDGVRFTRAPAMAMEYSNLGYALLGRIVANVSGQPYKDFVQRPVADAARHDVPRVTTWLPLPSRTARAWLPLGGQHLEARADDGAWRVRRDGRHPDQRHRLREMGFVPAFRVAASRRRRHRARCGVRVCASWRRVRTFLRCGCGRDRAERRPAVKPRPTRWAFTPRPTASSASR